MENNEFSIEYDTGITSEVFTIKSETKLIDIINNILKKKSSEAFKWIKSLDNISKNDEIIIIGAYLTGIAIAKELSKFFKDITVIDINPHLEKFILSKVGGKINNGTINFSNDLDLIYKGDIIIDTTGFGGLKPEESSKINCKAFLIENPCSDNSDGLLKNKNNIEERISSVNSINKSILYTEGLNTKTSGTMTFTISILNKSISDSLDKDGVLYSSCEMTFFEEIIFKEKDINKFLNLINLNAMKVSTINLFDIDNLINNNLNKLKSQIINFKQ